MFDLNYQLLELKQEYVRIQGDIEKMESTGHRPSKLEERLAQIEAQIKDLRERLDD